ncbi:hypothetical protein A0J61_10638 [Choanephora cucurbitarum]|uniref:Transcription activator GCR1-like domain-containing protein n=1 Tax=Choanephora cucurbitarum TaxID=101091 RepID=A0A1C7N1R4_9FUNG|nr:hypothetical protein A0J61_10638 [Choanephora cucurbitarum]
MNSQATRSTINSSSTSNDNNLAAINALMRSIATSFNQVDGEAEVDDEEEQLVIDLNNGLTGEPSSILVASTANLELVKYSMKRWVKTVPDLWLELTVGLEGIRSVDELNRLYNASWRRDEKERKMYSRPITFINGIKQLVSEGMTEEDALTSPYSASSGSPTELVIPNNNSHHNRNANVALTNSNKALSNGPDRTMRPTLMSPTPSPSSNINITKAHIPFSQPTESLVDPNSLNHSAYRPLNVTDALAYLDLVKN